MSITPMSPAIIKQGWVQTWVTSQWKNPSIPGQFSAEINNILVTSILAVYNTAANLPAVADGILRTEMWDNDSAGVQTFLHLGDYKIWRRRRVSSTWGAWSQTMDAFGSNSNGIFLRSATGLQICASAYASGVSRAFPASFASKPMVLATPDTGSVVADRYGTALNVTANVYTIQSYSALGGGSTSSTNGSMVAIGVY